MDIKLETGSYKSLTEFEWRDIPKFAVVTGPNGSGKTQMLELIAHAAGLRPRPEGTEQQRHYEPAPFTAKIAFHDGPIPENTVFLRSRDWRDPAGSANLQSILQQAEEVWSEKAPNALARKKWDRLWSIMEARLGIPRGQFTKEQFSSELPPNFILLSDNNSSEEGIPALFVSYLHSIDHLLQKGGRSREEIEKELSPLPWEVLDDILEGPGLSYRVVKPELPKHQRFEAWDIKYTLMLKDRVTGQHVSPSNLSSGERVMFRVALWFFSFSQRHQYEIASDSGRLLLLDEPDAHLHPALTKAFLRVIRSELVERHKLRVIMTTHSPSTVALADDASIFVMSRQSPRIEPALSRWRALGQLTSGFLSIGSQSKCVFVEGPDDRAFYTAAQTVLMDPSSGSVSLDSERSITFIDASNAHPGQGTGMPSGGKNNVLKWVETIPSTQIAGIIDRDEGNTERSRVHVLQRHSLECYLLDPLFLFAFLLEHEKAPKIPRLHVGIYDGRKLLQQSPENLQRIIDTMLGEMCAALSAEPKESVRVKVKYHVGPDLFLESWFTESSAKVLLEPLRKKYGFPFSHAELTRQYQLIGIIPAELVDIFQKIQTA